MNNEHKSTSNGLDITLMKKLLDDNFYFDFLNPFLYPFLISFH